MDKLSNHLNKTIINTATAEELGSLVGISIRDTDITHIVSSTDIAIVTGDIISLGDYITVSSNGAPIEGSLVTPIGGIAISSYGKALGIISDYEFTQTYKLKRIFCEGIVHNAAKIGSYNQKYMIFNQKNYVKRLISEDIVKPANPAELAVPEVTQPRQPVSDYSFLVGRIITRDIYAGSKRVFCANNSITDRIVSDAKTLNKLVELTLYSQKNI